MERQRFCFAKSDSLHRASEPCHLSLVQTVAVLGLEKRGGEAWSINSLDLPVGGFNSNEKK